MWDTELLSLLGMAGYSVNKCKTGMEDVKLVGGTGWETAKKYVGREARELTLGTVGQWWEKHEIAFKRSLPKKQEFFLFFQKKRGKQHS